MCQLRTTGEGIQDDSDNAGPDDSEEQFDHYVPISGSDDSTLTHIKSIWGRY